MSNKENKFRILVWGGLKIEKSLHVKYCNCGVCLGCNNFASRIRIALKLKILRGGSSHQERKILRIVMYEVNRGVNPKGAQTPKIALIYYQCCSL